MGVQLRKLCPNGELKTRRPRVSGDDDKRPRHFFLNSLEIHRAAFLKEMNIADHKWPEVEGDQ
jgi:hypothetical protein